jgi:hypothetical protein
VQTAGDAPVAADLVVLEVVEDDAPGTVDQGQDPAVLGWAMVRQRAQAVIDPLTPGADQEARQHLGRSPQARLGPFDRPGAHLRGHAPALRAQASGQEMQRAHGFRLVRDQTLQAAVRDPPIRQPVGVVFGPDPRARHVLGPGGTEAAAILALARRSARPQRARAEQDPGANRQSNLQRMRVIETA